MTSRFRPWARLSTAPANPFEILDRSTQCMGSLQSALLTPPSMASAIPRASLSKHWCRSASNTCRHWLLSVGSDPPSQPMLRSRTQRDHKEPRPMQPSPQHRGGAFVPCESPELVNFIQTHLCDERIISVRLLKTALLDISSSRWG